MPEKYNLIRPLGEGSFGKCYLVETQRDRELCVIKQINVRLMTDQEKEEAIREALILRELDHPNIIRFRDAYITKRGKFSIVMDFADGGDLQSRIRDQRGRNLAENKILDWTVQICLGLKHIHDRKILHRDLKTQNIFLTSKGMAKLGDFGIAKVLSHTSDNARTMVGTPYYLSPEIIENRPYSFKSDIWSLGVIIYELCCLKPPFDASSLHFLALKIVRGVYPPIPSMYSKELKSLLSRMLSTDPHKRPSIHKILQEPLLRNRISNFLSKSIQANEFSHTILHNHDLFNPVKRNDDEEYTSTHASEIEETKYTPPPEYKPEKPKEAWGEEKKVLLDSIRQKNADFMRQSIRGDPGREEQAEINAMEEALIEDEEDAMEYPEPEQPEEIPPPRDEDFGEEEEEEENVELLQTVNSYDKIEALRFYLEERLTDEVFMQAYQIIRGFDSQDDIGYDQYYVHLNHIMDKDVMTEFLPLIQALIDMENSQS